MYVLLTKGFNGNMYFEISTKDNYYDTSKEISEILNLDIDTYNKLLIEKVIQHEKFQLRNNKKISKMYFSH